MVGVNIYDEVFIEGYVFIIVRYIFVIVNYKLCDRFMISFWGVSRLFFIFLLKFVIFFCF